jgi:hypothetical protein
MRVLLTGGILGGIVLFLWSGISWMVIPWHAKTFNDFKSATQVTKVITENALISGIYTLPDMAHYKETPKNENHNALMKAPIVFAAVHLEDGQAMKTGLMKEFAIQLLAAFLVTWLLMQAKGLRYFGRVVFVTLFGFAAGVVSYLPLWNWFGFPCLFTSVAMADLIIGWYFAGLVIAYVTRKA